MSGYDDDADYTKNPMIASAKPGSNPRPLPQNFDDKLLSNILWDERRFSDNRSGVIIHPSDVDDWPVEKKQAFLKTTMSYIDGFDFDIPYSKSQQDDFNVAMAMAKKATVVLNTCPAEDILCRTNMRRYPMIKDINDESHKEYLDIVKWITGVLKIDTDYENSDKLGVPPIEYKYYSGYIEALNHEGVHKNLRHGGKRTRRKRGTKTKRVKTRRKRR